VAAGRSKHVDLALDGDRSHCDGLATPVIAYTKNRPVFLWLALGVLLAPIPFFFILFLPALPRRPYRPSVASGELRMTE
jgi:hypothetical protein